MVAAASVAAAETRLHYGGTLRVMLQSAPDALDLPATAAPARLLHRTWRALSP